MSETKIVGNMQHLDDLFPSLKEGVKTFSSYWSSPEKFAEHVESIDKRKAWHDSAWDGSDPAFYGTRSMQEALDLVRDGWKEGIERVHKLGKLISARYPYHKKPAEYSIVGAVPSVPRAVSGNPLSMRKFDPKKSTKKPIITLVSDMSAHCMHSQQEFINRAAVVCALIDQIEAAGYSCEVMSIGYTQNDMHARTHVLVKQCNQPVDIARLAFGLGHPAMFRRLVFADWGGDSFNRDLGGGLGYNLHFKPGSAEKKKLEERDIYVIPSANENYFFKNEESTIEKGLPYLLRSLRDQKFPVFDFSNLEEEPKKKEIPDDDDD